ncbi:hypothetical protein [Endozoicomonas sp. ONNA2]|uniref:hypothetical protein n=1 Tax=Endozoicomonas sp. ONNA2 TaxID=2828741 RepID=UPI00214824BF|nr:hypothetical protein [Endozoicomonas sp. ONNA2]
MKENAWLELLVWNDDAANWQKGLAEIAKTTVSHHRLMKLPGYPDIIATAITGRQKMPGIILEPIE